MKKTLIASAIAAATLSSTAFAMDPASELAAKLDSMPTVYGNIQLHYDINAVSDGVSHAYGLMGGGSTIGFKHSHEIAPGLTSFLVAEFDYDAVSKAGGAFNVDEAYFGVQGDFGKVWAGTDEAAYGSVDVIDYQEQVGVSGDLAGQTQTNTIHYQSASFDGVVIQTTLGVKSSTAEDYEFSATATYAMGDTTIIGGFSLNDNAGASVSGSNTYGVGVKHSLGDIAVAGQLEYQSENAMLLGGTVAYSMGENTFTGGLSYTDGDSTTAGNFAGIATNGLDSQVKFSAQAKHNVSKHIYAFVEFAYAANTHKRTAGTDLDVNETDLVLGAVYAF